MARFNKRGTGNNSAILRGSFIFLLIFTVTVVLLLKHNGDRIDVDSLTYSPAVLQGDFNVNRNYTHLDLDRNITQVSKIDTQSLIGISTAKTIIFWSGFYNNPPSKWRVNMGDIICGQYKCKLSYDRSKYREGDAFIFHLRCPSWVRDMKTLSEIGERLPNQRWIIYNRESAHWTKGEELAPASNHFNWTMGFRKDDTINIPTAVVKRGQYQDGYDPDKNYLEGKSSQVVVLMSMCNWGGYIPRTKYINLLKKSGLQIDILGSCGKKCGSLEDCMKIMRKYKFVLAAENSLCDDYVTEKAYRNGFRAGIIPIVVSKANLSDPAIFPPGSFINALNFSTTAALVEHVNKVGSVQHLYNSYFKWRANWTFTIVSEDEGHVPYPDDYFCPLCEKLHEDKKAQTIPDLKNWYEQEKCYPFPTN